MGRVLKSIFVGLTAAMIALPAAAETWRFASKMPAESPEGRVFQKFADEVDRLSEGAFKVKIFPSEQLGKSAAALEQLQRGTIQIYAEGSVWMKKWAKEIDLINTRFIFKNRDAWVDFIHSDMAQGWYRAAEERGNVKLLGDVTGIHRGPFRVVVSKDPIKSIEDFDGLKLRQASAKMAVLAYSTLGADVRNLGWTDTYQSMKTGVVDSVTSPAALVEAMRFYEVAPNVTRIDEMYQSIAIIMNAKAWENLSSEQKDVLLEAHKIASDYSAKLMVEDTTTAFERMVEKGVSFSELDVAPFVAKLRPIYDQLQADGGFPEGFLKAVDAANTSN